LGIAEQTVKAHASQIFRKLGVVSRTQAALVLNRLSPSAG
jgi:DNA-binding NarL/FixJ family response regulator